MNQSTSTSEPDFHVAVIMDGNGRWAAARGLPRTAGHVRGAEAVRRTVEAAPDLGIRILTLYAFSADNWKRPPAEVRTLLALFARHLRGEVRTLTERGVRLSVIGRRDRLPSTLVNEILRAESRTAGGRTLDLRIAIDYSGREAIARGEVGPDVDLVIRTGGEQRLSDFLLWESAYAELHFTPRAWPDFTGADLAAAVADFRGRVRRFGGIAAGPESAAIPAAEGCA
jgi:undecaprenyl diphosphate synthase